VSLPLKKVPVSQVPDSKLYSLVALSFFTKGLRNGIFPAISKMSQSSAIAVLQCELVSPEEMQERKTYLPLSSYRTAATPYVQTWGDRKWKYRILALGSWDAYQRNYFCEPRLLHLPVNRKVLNSLPWIIWFSLINNNLLMFLSATRGDAPVRGTNLQAVASQTWANWLSTITRRCRTAGVCVCSSRMMKRSM